MGIVSCASLAGIHGNGPCTIGPRSVPDTVKGPCTIRACAPSGHAPSGHAPSGAMQEPDDPGKVAPGVTVLAVQAVERGRFGAERGRHVAGAGGVLGEPEVF